MQANQGQALRMIRTQYGSLSKMDQTIADWILHYPDQVVHYTISQLAESLGIADSTVFRFCKRLGFSGFQAFKISLASEMVQPMEQIHETIEQGDSIQVITEKVFRSNSKTLEDTLSVASQEAMSDSVQAFLGADRIEFFGSGGSGIIAFDAYHKFIRSGLRVYANLDAHLQIMSAAQLSEHDVAVLISHSGSTTDILQLLALLKEKGTKTIAVTNFARSPLSKGADITLYTVSNETDYRSEALSSRIAQLTLLDALYVNVMMARKEAGNVALKNMREAISIKKM